MPHEIRSLRFTKGMDALPLRHPRSPIPLDWVSERGGSEGMASRDLHNYAVCERVKYRSVQQLPHRGLRDGMRRWTNGLPGATARLGANLAL